jgi:hypothetical protein
MPISAQGDTICFSCPEHPIPSVEYPLLKHRADDSGLILLAVWRAAKVPFINGEIAYFLYEGVAHPNKSQYRYWHLNGLAGMVLKPNVCSRLKLPNLKTLIEEFKTNDL